MTPEQLRTAVGAMLADGTEPEAVDRVRRRLGEDAAPAAVVAELMRWRALPLDGPRPGRDEVGEDGRHPTGPAVQDRVHAGTSARRPGTQRDAAAPPGGSAPTDATHLRVCGADMDERLAQTWPAGGPLYVRVQGNDPPSGPAVAVVGTRRPTLDGIHLAEGLAAGLAEAGVAVVSGLARGIDQAAHRAALAADGVSTAVIGTGHGVDYPAGSARLREALAASGGVVSEYAPGRGVRRPQQFLARNRILAGLADAVVVVEAGERSGALSTAGWALRFGREVLVVPSSPSNRAATGSLALLLDGAAPVRGARDVLDALGLSAPAGHPASARQTRPGAPAPRSAGLDGVAERVLGLLSGTPASPSAIADRTGCSPREVLVALSVLEDRGLARRDGGGAVRTG